MWLVGLSVIYLMSIVLQALMEEEKPPEDKTEYWRSFLKREEPVDDVQTERDNA